MHLSKHEDTYFCPTLYRSFLYHQCWEHIRLQKMLLPVSARKWVFDMKRITFTFEYASDSINMYFYHSEVRTVHFSNNPIFSFATSKITPSEAEVMTFFPVSTKSIINNFHIYQCAHYLIIYRWLRYRKMYSLQYLPCQSIDLEGMGDVTIYL